ncbi:hypothetical protein [Actinokineospora iranica]|uniref:Uncharacterized protein n=1 Tax=Actinokineospora iranica TaxID=1271860 RepID=A0A1G6QAH9_9PSEU|nr:hypothetical protein [Actinokineospora iranica]SDC89303.1 hypothetical protein SAMN05216174_105177 [Actinokineospora iranica]
MTDDVRDLLALAVRDEPPLALDRDVVIADGRRALRRRRTVAVGGVAAVVAVAVIGTTALTGGAYNRSDTIQPAAPVSTTDRPRAPAPPTDAPLTTTTRAPLSSNPLSSNPLSSNPLPPQTTTTKHLDDLARIEDLMRAGNLAWPTGVSGKRDGGGYTSTTSGVLAARLRTDTGDRWFTIDAYKTGSRQSTIRCLSAQDGKPLPNCAETRGPDGSGRRVSIAYPTQPLSPVVVMVTVERVDGTTVEVLDTAGVGPEWRSPQALSIDFLFAVAMLKGLATG